MDHLLHALDAPKKPKVPSFSLDQRRRVLSNPGCGAGYQIPLDINLTGRISDGNAYLGLSGRYLVFVQLVVVGGVNLACYNGDWRDYMESGYEIEMMNCRYMDIDMNMIC